MKESGYVPTALTRSIVASWFADTVADDRVRWLGLRPEIQDKMTRRLEAIVGFRSDEDPATVDQAAKHAGIGRRRFYQLACGWKDTSGLADLGLRATASLTRASTIQDNKIPAREAALREMRRLLREEPPPKTEAALRRVVDVVGADVSRKSLVRWWTTERRKVASGRVLGRDIAFDVCGIEIPSLAGESHQAAFVVDEGARLIFGGSVIFDGDIDLARRRAAADACTRLALLPLAQIPGASDLRRLAIAVPLGSNVMAFERLIDDVEQISGLPIVERYGSAIGRATVSVAGQRLGVLRLRRSTMDGSARPFRSTVADAVATGSAENGTRRKPKCEEMDRKDAALVLAAALDQHLDEVSSIIAKGPSAVGGAAAAERITTLLRSIASIKDLRDDVDEPSHRADPPTC